MKNIMIILLSCFMFFGCGTLDEKKDIVIEQPTVQSEKIVKIEESLTKNSDKIKTIASDITRISKQTEVITKSNQILYVNEDNIKTILQLKDIEVNLQATQIMLDELKNENLKLEEQITSAKSEVEKSRNKLWLWIIGVNAIILSASIYVAIAYNLMIGSTVGATNLIMICFAYCFTQFATYAAIVGGVIALGGVIFAIYNVKKNEKALKEVVETTEVIKNKSWDEATKSIVNNIQSVDTKQIVSSIKEKL